MSSRLQKQDYYFGAGLFKLLSKNNDSRPSLLECSENVRTYQIITDTSEEFHVYMKYAGSIGRQKNEKYWQFNISDSDRYRFNELLQTGLKTYLMLICGDDKMREGEVALLTADEFKSVASEKTAVRVKLIGNSPKVFTIANQDSRKVFSVPRNRIECKLTDVDDPRMKSRV